MKDGHPVGRVFHYGQHGQLEKEENFNQNGELDGIQKDNIQGRETNYSNGQKNGEEIYYDVSGKPLRSASYKNGELHGKSMNYENGDFEYYKNGEQYGPFQKTIQRNFEKIVSSGRVTNGKHLVTDRMTYSSDGKILHEEHFNENGNRHGLERYPEQGREIPWNDGERDGV